MHQIRQQGIADFEGFFEFGFVLGEGTGRVEHATPIMPRLASAAAA